MCHGIPLQAHPRLLHLSCSVPLISKYGLCTAIGPMRSFKSLWVCVRLVMKSPGATLHEVTPKVSVSAWGWLGGVAAWEGKAGVPQPQPHQIGSGITVKGMWGAVWLR